MDAINYSALRANLAKTMDKVCENHKPVIITRQGGEPVVMLSLEDYESLDETAYLLSSPENARHLRRSLEEYKEGRLVERSLIDCE